MAFQQTKSTAVIQPPTSASFLDFNKEVDRKRKEGLTDTEILKVLSNNSQNFSSKISTAQSKFGDKQFYGGEDINNDRDLVNFLSSGYSGKLPSMPSIPAPEEVGIGKSIAQGIVKPFARAGTNLLNLGETAYDLARGDIAGAAEAINKRRTVPGLDLEVKAFGLADKPGETLSVGEFAKDIIGGGLEIGSYFAPGAIVTKGFQKGAFPTIKALAGAGAVEGFTGGLGIGLQEEDATVGSVAGSTALGTGIGAVGGPILGKTIQGVTKIPGAIRTGSEIISGATSKLSQKTSGAIQTTGEFVDTIRPRFKNKTAPTTDIAADVAETPFNEASTIQLMTSAIKPGKNNRNFKNDLPTVLRMLADDAGAIVGEGTEEGAGRRMLDAMQTKMKSLWNEIDAAVQGADGKGAFINRNGEIAEAILEGLSSPKLQRENPQLIKVLEDLSEIYKDAIPVGEADEILRETNAVLQSFYRANNTSRNKVFKSDPKLAAQIRIAETLRSELDNVINRVSTSGAPEFRGLNRNWGAFRNILGELEGRLIVAERQNITSLAEQLSIGRGLSRAAGNILTGSPIRAAASLGEIGFVRKIKKFDSTDGKIWRAFRRLEGIDELSTAPVTRTSREALLEEARKFDTAEEFIDNVNKNNDIIFHGNAKIGKEVEVLKPEKSGFGGTSFSDNADISKPFAFDVPDSEGIMFALDKNKLNIKRFESFDDLRRDPNYIENIDSLDKEGRDLLKSQGFDAIEFPNIEGGNLLGNEIRVIRDVDRSELINLTDIFEEANNITKAEPRFKNAVTDTAKPKAVKEDDILSELKSGKGFGDELKGRDEVLEAIDDIGGLNNVERGNVSVEKLSPTETFNVQNEGVQRAIKEIESGFKPPLIVEFQPPNFYDIMDGNHRYIAYKHLGIKEIPIITNKGGIK